MWPIGPVGFFVALLVVLPGAVAFAVPAAWRWVCVAGAVCAVAFSAVPISYYGPLLVRRGKGGKPRRQPLPPRLADELRDLHAARQPAPDHPVVCGLGGGRLQETILADVIRRASKRAGLEKHVTAHTLRHTAAIWLRQELGDTRLVAECLGHAGLSTVSRYAHVAREELFAAAGRLENLATHHGSAA